ncbi:nuclear transport factor 2 family protein [Nocardia sp. NPDC046763]|uniref:nuclear transport factor 2 family protein n=1 Tax=Nocardia sp. NPDC046763 TaxID=3155256 RepID=UPI0033F7BEE0
MSTITTTDMPPPVHRYFEAMNRLDGSGMAAPFPADGLVNDIQREFWGPDAIKRWADKESVGDNVVVTKYVEAKEHYGDYIVSAEVDGDYDKTGLPDPLVLTFYFSLAGDRISRLIILGNKPGY